MLYLDTSALVKRYLLDAPAVTPGRKAEEHGGFRERLFLVRADEIAGS